MASSAACLVSPVRCSSAHKPTRVVSPNVNLHHLKVTFSSAFKQKLRQLPVHIDVSKAIKSSSRKLLDALVDSLFEFVDQPFLPSQSNFAPVAELGEPVLATEVEGIIPQDFPEGVYLRHGGNPRFGRLKAAESIFGRSSFTWVEGEGMLHALYLSKMEEDKKNNHWVVALNRKYIQTKSFKIEKERKRPAFLPSAAGDPLALLFALLLNMMRFGMPNKELSNTNVFEHCGKFYSISENHIPQEINIFTLDTFDNWDLDGAWVRPFTSHPKKAPRTGELVIMGFDAKKPYFEVGVVSDGKLIHKADLRFDKANFSHEIGVTERFNIIMTQPVTIEPIRLIRGQTLIKHEKEGCTRIGVMPRYGDGDSVKWFDVKPNVTFHLINCFEDGDEVVVYGCRALNSVIPGPETGRNNYEWFSRRYGPLKKDDGTFEPEAEKELLFSRPYEWRLDMKSGEVKERYLTGVEFPMDFPAINEAFTGLRNKYGYLQVRDPIASSASGMAKFGGLAKLCFEQPIENYSQGEDSINVEYHMLEENVFCSGASFVPKAGGVEEDDGWIITFVHNESTNISQAHIIDAKNFSGKAVAKIILPSRVPYGFHATFVPAKLQISKD